PYLAGEFTRGIIPSKLFETLASGKPVVAMGMPELEPYRDLVTLCVPPRFAECVERALADHSPARREAQMTAARANSWAARVDQAWRVMAELLEARGRHAAS
ncbi:MAG TPA: hypothetical protein VD793_01270, partial [Gemmatimonadales bacterium]|nr:hypothetical protein [Gemmatimonadales bacterium]